MRSSCVCTTIRPASCATCAATYACHLIEPGTVRVRDLRNGRGFAIEFLDAPFHNGEFTFASSA